MLVDMDSYSLYTFSICGGEERNLFVTCERRYYNSWQAVEAAAMRKAIYAFGPRGWHYIDYYHPTEQDGALGSDEMPTHCTKFITRQMNLDAW